MYRKKGFVGDDATGLGIPTQDQYVATYARRAGLEQERAAIAGSLQETRELLTSLDDELARGRDLYSQKSSRLQSLKELEESLEGYGEGVKSRTVDVHIRRLRKALEPHGFENLVQTVRGVGYRFSAQQA